MEHDGTLSIYLYYIYSCVILSRTNLRAFEFPGIRRYLCRDVECMDCQTWPTAARGPTHTSWQKNVRAPGGVWFNHGLEVL